MRSTPELAEPSRRRLDLDLRPTDVLRALRHRSRLVALSGAWHQGEALIAFEPVVELGPDDDPFAIDLPGDGRADGRADGSFGGGWIGLWGYRLGASVERLPAAAMRPVPQPDHVVGFYDHVLRLSDGCWWAEGVSGRAALDEWVDALLHDVDQEPLARPYELGSFELTPTPEEHRLAVGKVIDHIEAGDIFQANLSARLEAEFVGDPLDVFCRGVEVLAPARAAYIGWQTGAVASLSPELFLRRTGSEVLTSPIKGTAPLSSNPDDLVASSKDRAENVMIVDLMRNDLGRVCVPGSVRVPVIARAERHAVWHLVSDVVGRLRPGVGDGDLLRATFPPGSVTGAPKVRAMEIIAGAEATGREAYTGAIGHVSATAGLELNVAIRTFEFHVDPTSATGLVWLGVGGGIVADSTPDGEYAECLAKARPLIDAVDGRLEGLGVLPETPPSPPAASDRPSRPVEAGVFETVLVDGGAPIDPAAHIARLDASVRSLYGTTVRAGLEAAVHRKTHGLRGPHRLRIDAVPRRGDVDVTLAVSPLSAEPEHWSLHVRVINGGWGAHKWLDRAELGPTVPGRDTLLIDADGSVLETTRASVFCVLDDGVHTPQLDGRILPGTMRARVIEALQSRGIPVHQHRLTTAALAAASEVWVTNALRGVVPVTSIDGVGAWPAGPIAERLGQWPPPEGPTTESSRTHGGAGRVPDPARVLFIDNYDSFVHNLVQYAGELGASTEVVRNDAAKVEALVAARRRNEFTHVVISPGPGRPADAGISSELVRRLGPTTPVLGVCLGHQVVGEVYGARVVRAADVVHGKPSLVHHDGVGVFAGLPSPITCARYHSLVIDPQSISANLQVTARTAAGVVMGVRHREHPVEGVQMHPESILTHRGREMLATFLARRPAAD